jgi:hypothetical protein
MTLTLTPNITDPDGFYKDLIDSQRNLDDREAARMNCKLVLLLANHIGDRSVIRDALIRAGGTP